MCRRDGLNCEKEIACCDRCYHVYKDTWAAAIAQLGKCFCVAGSQAMQKNSCRKKYFYIVRFFFYNENKANYGMHSHRFSSWYSPFCEVPFHSPSLPLIPQCVPGALGSSCSMRPRLIGPPPAAVAC